jgi:hypothetical protein
MSKRYSHLKWDLTMSIVYACDFRWLWTSLVIVGCVRVLHYHHGLLPFKTWIEIWISAICVYSFHKSCFISNVSIKTAFLINIIESFNFRYIFSTFHPEYFSGVYFSFTSNAGLVKVTSRMKTYTVPNNIST